MDRTSRKSRRLTTLAAVGAATVLLATACAGGSDNASGGGSGDRQDDGSKSGAPRLKIAVITHAAPGDTFWDLVRKGAEAAAAKDNVDLDFVSDPDGADQADLIRKAVEEKVDGIAVTLAKPDAMRSAIASARKERIPVVGLNSGIDAWEAQHLLAYFGQDENVAGQALGRRLNALGAEHVACVIHERGNIALEARCAGVRKTFGRETENVYVNGADMESVQSTITAKLRRDPSVDEVVTLGAPFALTAVESVSDAGSGAEVATFDLNKDLVKAVRGGKVQLAVDQQPYLQGYLAVDSLWLYTSNGNYSGGGVAPVLTGPAFVTKENIADVERFAAKGTR